MKKSEIQQFFAERMAEINHKDTIDSFRVRSNNVFTLLKECLEVIEGWKNANVKMFETVEYCVDELVDAVEKDSYLLYEEYSKENFLKDLKEYNKWQKQILFSGQNNFFS